MIYLSEKKVLDHIFLLICPQVKEEEEEEVNLRIANHNFIHFQVIIFNTFVVEAWEDVKRSS